MGLEFTRSLTSSRPVEELDKKQFHFLCPKVRMPINGSLRYLHRARWNIGGGHTEHTWFQRLPES
jgi:hypothetical protein